MNETATKDTWKNIPIDNPKRIDIDLLFTDNGDLWLGTHEIGAWKFNGQTFVKFVK